MEREEKNSGRFNSKGSHRDPLPKIDFNSRGSAQGSSPINILNNKRGQVTIFIIIGIIIIATIVLVFIFQNNT